MSDKYAQPPGFKLHADASLAVGEYTNGVASSSSPVEVALDFYQVLAGTTDAHLRRRMLMHPVVAKRFHEALGETLRRHEEMFGAIGGGAAQIVFDAKSGN